MKLEDGQFDECGLTLRDLKLVEQSLIRSMASIYHHRIKYPDDPDAKKSKAQRKSTVAKSKRAEVPHKSTRPKRLGNSQSNGKRCGSSAQIMGET